MLTEQEQTNLTAAATAAVACETAFQFPAEITLAQWALESGWGCKMPPGSNNPFGIKAVGDQPFVEAETTEFVEGKPETVMQKFRAFASLQEAFEDHALLITTGQPYKEAWDLFQMSISAMVDLPVQQDLINHLIDGIAPIYATDPNYATKIKQIGWGEAVTAALQTARSAT